MTTALSIDDLRTHIGRRLTAADVIHAGPANLLRLALGRPEAELGPGETLPPAWLALYFLRVSGPTSCAPTAARATPAWCRRCRCRDACSRARACASPVLRIGDAVRRETELADMSVKSGGTGTLVFATVLSRVFDPDGLAIEEERRTVFREEVKAGDRNQAPRREPAPDDVPWRRKVLADPVLLFRYSALTFNSHRIHYDRTWATETKATRAWSCTGR